MKDTSKDINVTDAIRTSAENAKNSVIEHVSDASGANELEIDKLREENRK